MLKGGLINEDDDASINREGDVSVGGDRVKLINKKKNSEGTVSDYRSSPVTMISRSSEPARTFSSIEVEKINRHNAEK